MTYFRMGIHTIIGAGSFHCPVRDGKEWDQTAVAARLKLSNRQSRPQQDIRLLRRINCDEHIGTSPMQALSSKKQSPSNDRVKPHEQLVQVSFTRYRASTPCLSTSWSRTAL